MLDPKQFQSNEDYFSFNVESLYQAHHIIEGYNVNVELVKTPHELEIELLKLNPNQVILTEPNVEFIRIIEVFEASRQQMEKGLDEKDRNAEELKVHMLLYANGTEKFMYMNTLEEEKRSM